MNGSLEIITGPLGSGKTLFGVERMIADLTRGFWVFTQVEMRRDEIASWMAERGLEFDPARLVSLEGSMERFHLQLKRGTPESPVTAVIDETHLEFNSKDHAKTDREVLEFATLCRKLDIKLIFITQDEDNVNVQFRRLANFIWRCSNASALRILGVAPCPIPLMFRVCYGVQKGKLTRQYCDVSLRSSEMCKLYKSDALLGPNAQKFAAMGVAVATKLKKIKPVRKTTGGIGPWVAFGAALGASFWASL